MASKNIVHVLPNCVACGSCEKACPLGAIAVYKGLWAKVNPVKCVGCGKCVKACPGGVLKIFPREESVKEKCS